MPMFRKSAGSAIYAELQINIITTEIDLITPQELSSVPLLPLLFLFLSLNVFINF